MDIQAIRDACKDVKTRRRAVHALQGQMDKSIREQLGVPKLKYDDRFPELVRLWGSVGQFTVQIARNFGISTETMREWREAHPDFDAAIKDAETSTTSVTLSRVMEGDLDLNVAKYVLNANKLLIEYRQMVEVVDLHDGDNKEVVIDFGDRLDTFYEEDEEDN